MSVNHLCVNDKCHVSHTHNVAQLGPTDCVVEPMHKYKYKWSPKLTASASSCHLEPGSLSANSLGFSLSGLSSICRTDLYSLLSSNFFYHLPELPLATIFMELWASSEGEQCVLLV